MICLLSSLQRTTPSPVTKFTCCIFLLLHTAFYISLRRHRQQNTYGIAPMIVVTRAMRKDKSLSSSSRNKTVESTLFSDSSRYNSCDGVSHAYSDWSINTSDAPTSKPTSPNYTNGRKISSSKHTWHDRCMWGNRWIFYLSQTQFYTIYSASSCDCNIVFLVRLVSGIFRICQHFSTSFGYNH